MNENLKIGIIAFILMFLLGFPLISATLGTFEKGSCVDIKTILNVTSVNISTISDPNSDVIVSNQIMTKQGYTFNYTFCNTTLTGSYVYDFFDNLGNTYVNDFKITPNGEEPSGANASFYIGLLFVLVIFLGFSMYAFVKFDNLLSRVATIGASYLLLMGITFIGWNMAEDFLTSAPFIIDMLRISFYVLLFGFLPLLFGGFAWYVLMLFKIKEIERLMTKGFSENEAERRVFKRK